MFDVTHLIRADFVGNIQYIKAFNFKIVSKEHTQDIYSKDRN